LNLVKVLAGGTFVTFSWSAPTSDGGSPITDYQVYWDAGERDDIFVVLLSSTGNTLSFTQTAGITSDEHYEFKVRAVNLVGASDYS
jgi:hypothetical protein